MSNIVYDDKMYNEEIKREYMEQYKEGTYKILKRIFNITAAVEEELGKDLYDFSREELRRTFWLFMASTPNASRANCQYCTSYLDWCIEEGYLEGINPLDGTDMKWKEQFVVQQTSKRFWTDKEMQKIQDKLVNAQDSVILEMLWNGIRGHENSEITNLKRKDVDFESGILTLTDADGSQRKMKVSDKTLALIERAIREDEYMKRNGNASRDVKAESAELISNQYVVRSSNTRTINLEDADKNIVYRRLAVVASEFDEHLTPANVYYSGALSLARELYQQGKLDASGYKIIAERYNVTDAVIQRLKSDFLNEETIKELYDLP